jgi:hypothetical protein
MLDKLKALTSHSATVAWAYLQIAVAALLASLDVIGAVIADPYVQDQVQAIAPPTWVPALVALMGVVTLVVRMRSLLRPEGE